MEPNAERKRATSTSAFGVSRRENHDASGFYGRFPAPTLSPDDTVEPPGVVAHVDLVDDPRGLDGVVGAQRGRGEPPVEAAGVVVLPAGHAEGGRGRRSPSLRRWVHRC